MINKGALGYTKYAEVGDKASGRCDSGRVRRPTSATSGE